MLKQKLLVSSHLEGRVQFWVNHVKRKLQPEKKFDVNLFFRARRGWEPRREKTNKGDSTKICKLRNDGQKGLAVLS